MKYNYNNKNPISDRFKEADGYPESPLRHKDWDLGIMVNVQEDFNYKELKLKGGMEAGSGNPEQGKYGSVSGCSVVEGQMIQSTRVHIP